MTKRERIYHRKQKKWQIIRKLDGVVKATDEYMLAAFRVQQLRSRGLVIYPSDSLAVAREKVFRSLNIFGGVCRFTFDLPLTEEGANSL